MWAIFCRRRKPVLPLQFASCPSYNTDCAICLSPIAKDPSVLPCGHGFHSECIQDHMEYHMTCPLCRTKLILRKV